MASIDISSCQGQILESLEQWRECLTLIQGQGQVRNGQSSALIKAGNARQSVCLLVEEVTDGQLCSTPCS
jgi:hypothetical protein